MLLPQLRAQGAAYGCPARRERTMIRVVDRVRKSNLAISFLTIILLILLAITCGLFPAISAYRTDVAESLSD
mgnify:CR=1 FL=1